MTFEYFSANVSEFVICLRLLTHVILFCIRKTAGIDSDTSDLIDPERYIPELIMYIRQNEIPHDSSDLLSGTYILKYDVSSDFLYFEFVSDRSVSLYIDAHTGEISDTLMR